MNRVAQRRIRLLEVETATPSPFAASLLFGYVGAFMYEGDSPLAERRAAALSLDSVLLAELLGPRRTARAARPADHRVDHRPAAAPDRRTRGARRRGRGRPAAAARPADRGGDRSAVHRRRRRRLARGPAGGATGADGVVRRRRRGGWPSRTSGCCATASASPVPVGVPASFTESVADPLGELLGRYARTHGPFTTRDAAARFGLGLRVTADVLGRMAVDGKLVRGEFLTTGDTEQWCDADVLKILRRRSLAALRAQVEPVSTAAYARFLPAWQQVGTAKVSGIDGLAVGDRTACGRAHSGIGGRAAGVRPAGPRLLTGHARRTAGRRRGHLVRRRADRQQRRLDRLPLRRLGAVDDGRARRDRVHRRPPGDHGHARARRRVLLPATRR